MAGLPQVARGFCGRLVRGSASCSDDARAAERMGCARRDWVQKRVHKSRKSDRCLEFNEISRRVLIKLNDDDDDSSSMVAG